MRYWIWIGLWVSLATAKDAARPFGYDAVVRQVSGNVRLMGPDTSSKEVKVGDLPQSGEKYAVGEGGGLIVRFHPDFMRIVARANTMFHLAFSRSDSSELRDIVLDQGLLALSASKRGPSLKTEDAHSLVQAVESRFSFASASGVSTTVVLAGEVKLRNTVTNQVETVHRGQKAVSDSTGVKLTTASQADLQEVSAFQNFLEMDFWNPSTKESRTLEMEYETNF
ncbi:MAG TPA: hypothetical protein DCQ83_08215 [Fibrobacteres bacterium]|jgi:hypothetical protein|nr:hypothetical protein [Fibrobacterota bacterium]